nr:MAG TPA: hypothetical protein [Caudoviricetes sp.]
MQVIIRLTLSAIIIKVICIEVFILRRNLFITEEFTQED